MFSYLLHPDPYKGKEKKQEKILIFHMGIDIHNFH